MLSFLFSKWRTITGLVDWRTVFFPYRYTPIQLVSFKVPFLSQPANVTVERKVCSCSTRHAITQHGRGKNLRGAAFVCRWLIADGSFKHSEIETEVAAFAAVAYKMLWQQLLYPSCKQRSQRACPLRLQLKMVVATIVVAPQPSSSSRSVGC